MPSASLAHAAIFTAGALVGGGVAAAVASQKRQIPTSAPVASAPVAGGKQVSLAPPIVSTGANGQPQLIAPGATAAVLEPVLKYGNPGPVSDLLVHKGYTAGYDRRLKHPAWTAEHLTLASLGKSRLEAPPEELGGDRSKSTFKEDESIPEPFRAKLKDYFRSGYDRGHMVPAADCKSSQEAMDETFLLSNIAPQVGDGFNRHYWAYLEDWCRRLTGNFSDVYVFTVPLYIPAQGADGKWRVTHEVIGSPPNVAVPTHFAKVVLTSRPSSPSTPQTPEISTGAFILPNAVIPDHAPLESFVAPVEKVEQLAGLTIFSDEVKRGSKHICKTTKCDVVVRRFDEAQKRRSGSASK